MICTQLIYLEFQHSITINPYAMKKIIIISIIILLGCPIVLIGQIRTQNSPYQYPITGGQEWGKLYNKDFDNRVIACEVPQETLDKMTSGALLETCLNYPLNYTLLASNNKGKTLSGIIEKSNAYQELVKRKDLVPVVIQAFANLDPRKIRALNDFKDQQKFWLKQNVLGLFIANNHIMSLLTEKEKRNIVEISLDKIAKMESVSDIYSAGTIAIANIHMVTIVNENESDNFRNTKAGNKINDFVATGINIDLKTYNDLKERAINYIKN